MPELRPVLFVLGLLLSALAAAMLLPALLDAVAGDQDWQVFVLSAMFTFVTGGMLALANFGRDFRLNLRQGFILTVLSWLVISAFSSLPFLFSELELTHADAFFEAISGLTTTGATVLSGLDTMPAGILLWRAILHWFGGIGIIGMAVAILPMLRVGGMQLFRMESSDRSEKLLPRPRQIATAITLVYVSLTAACGVAYWLAGMSVFDALCHALSTIPTGGFSNHDRSFAHFDSPMVDAIGVIFMLIGGMPIVLLAQSLRGGPVLLWRSSQVRAFLGIVSLTSSLLALWLWWDGQYGATEAVRHAFFNVTSIVTTTGLASADYTLWAPFASYVFFVLTFVGACTGSTSGGIKIFRFQVMLTVLTTMLKRLVHPRAIFPREYEDKALTPDVIESVFVFVVVFIATVGALALVLGLTGLDFVTSISAAATAVANVGPGLGPIVGPVGNFAPLPEEAKWALSFGMLVGRLELFTVLVLLMPSFWRD